MKKAGLNLILSRTTEATSYNRCKRTLIKTSDLKKIVTELLNSWDYIDKYKKASWDIRKKNFEITALTSVVKLKR